MVVGLGLVGLRSEAVCWGLLAAVRPFRASARAFWADLIPGIENQ